MTTNRMGLEQTLSDERLEEVANIGSVDQMAFPPSHAQCAAMARELLAYRKASERPVAWRYRTTDINGNPNPRWSFSEEASLMGLYQPLYAAPPIQAVTVPDEMTIRDACKFVQDMRIFDDVSVIVMRTWNACRAAMLKSVTNEP